MNKNFYTENVLHKPLPYRMYHASIPRFYNHNDYSLYPMPGDYTAMYPSFHMRGTSSSCLVSVDPVNDTVDKSVNDIITQLSID